MAERLRIAFVTPRFAPQRGGAETYSRCLLSELAARHDIHVVASAARDMSSDHLEGPLPVRRVGPIRTEGLASRVRSFPAFTHGAMQALEEIRPDVVLAHYSGLHPASRYARRARVPLVALVHAVFSLGELIRTRGVVAGTLRYAANERLLAAVRPDAVITPSRATAEAVRRLVRGPVHVVGAGVDHVPDGRIADESTPQVVFVGRLVPSKGVADAVRAVAALRTLVPAASLLVVGAGPQEREIPSWVRHTPALPDDELDREVRRSAALVLPSVQEGWGLVVCEAAARGVPYVAYDIPAVREQHEVLEGGVLVRVGDIAALTRALEELMTDAELRRRLGQTGRERARARLRWADVAATTERVIR